MKLFIPPCGYRIRLVKDWSFDLYRESRNHDLAIVLKTYKVSDDYHASRYEKPAEGTYYGNKLRHDLVTIPANTVLEVDRVYIRTFSKNAASKDDDFDSITFRVKEHTGWAGDKHPRFWAKLCDVNTIEYEDVAPGEIKDRKDPRKLTSERCSNALRRAFRGVWIDQKGVLLRDSFFVDRTNQGWFTQDFIDSMIACDLKLSTAEGRKNWRSYGHGVGMIVDAFTYASKCKFSRAPEACVRHYTSPNHKDMWITVVTNKEDNEILEVKCGVGLTPAE